MRLHYRDPPSCTLVRAAFAMRTRARVLRWPIVIALVLVWTVLLPPAWLLVKLGNLGHDIAGFCGFDSRDGW